MSSRLRLFSVQDQRLASSAEAASLFSRHDFSYDVHARAYVRVRTSRTAITTLRSMTEQIKMYEMKKKATLGSVLLSE